MFLLDIDSAKVELSFSTTEYDDKYDEYEKLLGERIELLEALKNLYDIVYLKKIFKESKTQSLSSLMIGYYDKHKEDLKFLKQVFCSIIWNHSFSHCICFYIKKRFF